MQKKNKYGLILFLAAMALLHSISIGKAQEPLKPGVSRERINPKKSFESYKKAAEQGSADAWNELGTMYESGNEVAQDYAEAMKAYRVAAEKGDVEALANIGRLYKFGLGVPKDRKSAFEWFDKAAVKGFPEAQVLAGLEYQEGIIIPRDYKKALVYFIDAARQGNPEGAANAGQMFHYGHGVERDLLKAGEWYYIASEKGLTALRDYLAQSQIECSKDKRTAGHIAYNIEACLLAAATNDLKAIHAVGIAYLSGNGLRQDKAQAYKWFLKGAQLGSLDCQVHLAVMLSEGDGITPDHAEAYRWFSVAQGNPDLTELQRKIVVAGKKNSLNALGFTGSLKAKFNN